MQQASCLEGGPLLWIWPLYLHVNKKSDDDGELLENVQRRAMRIVPELRGLNYRERLEKLNLPTLYHRRKHYDLIQLFRIVHGYEDIKPEKFLKFIDNCTRGIIFKITKPRCQKSFRLNSFPARCINQWNNLDEDIVCSNSVLSFNTRIDRASFAREIRSGKYSSIRETEQRIHVVS